MSEPLDLDALEARAREFGYLSTPRVVALIERVRRAEGALRMAREYVGDHPRLVATIDAALAPEQAP